MREINGAASGQAGPIACYVSIEDCQGVTDVDDAMRTMYQAIQNFADFFKVPVPQVAGEKDIKGLLQTTLKKWAELVAPRPLIVLFDEVDVLQGEPLISFLRQLRGGFASRGVGVFPISIALVGMRDLKDYITAAKGGVPVNPGSPFNIKEDSAYISNFQKGDVVKLFAQRTAETGQQITAEALDYVYNQSQGQPWIVNSLFKRATMRILNEESTETVTIGHLREAREQMILARETHLDALAYRLEDPQIRKVMESLMAGEPDPLMAQGEPFRLCLDLGLVTLERGTPQVANPIYREVFAREVTYSAQLAIPEPEWKWEQVDGTLDMDALLKEFQKFWRNHSEVWEEKLDYTEALPYLLLMAFLQRVANGEGSAMDGAVSNAGEVCDSKLPYSNRQGSRFEYEYAAGRGRMDLAIEYKGAWNIIEIKLLRQKQSFESVKAEGIKQILQYRERIAPAAPCYLVIFDRRAAPGGEHDWAERLTWEYAGGAVTVVGC
jgi:hypothetical protein